MHGLALLLASASALLARRALPPRRPLLRAASRAPLAPLRAAEDASSCIEVRDTKDRGRGVYAVAPIRNGSWVTDYAGEVLDSDELLRRHPDGEPAYAFRVAETTYIDGEDSTHWSARINHDALAPNLEFEVTPEPPRVRFTASRDIAVGDELVFDYGEEYWDGRSHAPLEGTDARIYAAPVLCDRVDLGVPLSEAALSDVLAAKAQRAEKVAALRRALDYYGVDQRAVPVPPPAWRLWSATKEVDAASASPPQLARALRVCFSWG